MTEWADPQPVSIPPTLLEAVGGHRLVAETLVRRGISDDAQARAYLDPDQYRPASPLELPGMDEAIERIRIAIENGEQICVWGDFDVDGQTSTTLLVEALTLLGANVFHHIPVRADESHGVNLPKLKEMIARGASLVLTCDTGIASHGPLAYARSQGVDVVVTDHHSLPRELPEAAALVNPQMLPEDHPLRTLPGVGVAFKLAEGLFAAFERGGEESRFLDLVALGIVADVAELRNDTRYLLQRGLEVLRNTRRAGLQALFRTAGIDRPENINEETIGFAIGPRLNALGRLGDANPIVDFLTTTDPARAGVTSEILEGLNEKRRAITSQIYEAALAQLDKHPELRQMAGLVLAQQDWHPGIIGIVASRLVEQFGKPTILIALDGSGIGRGSGRSVEGVNITEAIAAQKASLLSFGGHPMAAGLAISVEEIERFRRGFSKAVQAARDLEAAQDVLPIDGYLGLPEISERLVEELDRLGPFGPGNPPLVFAARGLTVRTRQVLGRTGEHLRLVVRDAGENLQDVVWWRGAGQPQPEGTFDLAFSLRMNDFKGRRNVQVVWLDSRPAPEPQRMEAPRRKKLEVIDLRNELDPEEALRKLQQKGVLQIWGEAVSVEGIQARSRDELVPADDLVIWTAPADAFVLAKALERARPARVFLFADVPETQEFRAFVTRLAGLCKFVVARRDGGVDLERLAGKAAHSERTVLQGLEWLSAAGYFSWSLEGRTVALKPGSGKPQGGQEAAGERLKRMLEEAVAYRGMFRRAPAEFLIENG